MWARCASYDPSNLGMLVSVIRMSPDPWRFLQARRVPSRTFQFRDHLPCDYAGKKSPTLFGRTFDRHVTADFDTRIGAGNVDKASAEKAARFHSCRWQ
jgi:hypothetical protein